MAIIDDMPTPTNPIRFADLVAKKPLNLAEQDFVACMAEGRRCIIGDKRPTKAHDGKNGEQPNVIRADLIRFFAWGGDEHAPIRGNIIALSGANISGVLDLLHVSSPYALTLMHCRFDSRVNMLHARFRSLNLGGSYLSRGLNGSGMHVGGSVFMRNGFSANGEVHLIGVNIGGDVDCDGSEFKNEEGKSLVADRAKVGGNFLMRDNFTAEGGVCLPGANIGGDVDCNSGKFISKKDGAFFASDLKVGGDFFMGNNFTAEGGVILINADIGGDVDCNGGKLINKKGDAFVADGIKVGGNFFMGNSFTAEGGVSLLGADIGGNVHCTDSEFKNEKGSALAADRIKVGGNFVLLGGFSADGLVRLSAADIRGSLYCISSNLKKGFNASAARVRKFLHFRNLEGRGTVNLSFAVVDVLEDDEKSRKNFDFRLGGFSYQRFGSLGEIKVRIKTWLDKRPKNINFSPQPFEQAAKVLFAMGHNNDAREVLWAKEQRLTEEGKLPDWHKPARKVWDWLAGYGYRLRRILFWSVGIIFAGMVVFNFADHSCRIVPHQPVVLANKVYTNAKTERCIMHRQPTKFVEDKFPAYPRFEPLFYSLDVFIPFFALHMESHWYPQSEDGDTDIALRLLRLWYWFEIGMGWVLTSLLVLSITGLLKPRQSSLE